MLPITLASDLRIKPITSNVELKIQPHVKDYYSIRYLLFLAFLGTILLVPNLETITNPETVADIRSVIDYAQIIVGHAEREDNPRLLAQYADVAAMVGLRPDEPSHKSHPGETLIFDFTGCAKTGLHVLSIFATPRPTFGFTIAVTPERVLADPDFTPEDAKHLRNVFGGQLAVRRAVHATAAN